MAKEKNNNAKAAPTPDDAHSAANQSNQKTAVADHPTLLPPSLSAPGGGLVSNQKIVGTYGTANALNQWLNITGTGFRKVSTANANAHLAISIIGHEAYEKQSSINYSLDANNIIQEIYAW